VSGTPAVPASAVRARVRRSYGAAASGGAGCGCGTGGCACGDAASPLADEAPVRIGAGPATAGESPTPLAGPALGCGDPLAFADVAPGDVVLDLGSGAGAEVLRAARLAAPGMAIGVDMTAEMLALAARNRRTDGVAKAHFVGGEIESLPLRDGSVDVVVSNCVLNLSPEKAAVFAEVARVLRPGGRLAVADVVVVGDREPPAAWRADAAAWDACVRGAMTEAEVLRRLGDAGFTGVRLERLSGPAEPDPAGTPAPRVASDLILAVKPGGSAASLRAKPGASDPVRAVKPAASDPTPAVEPAASDVRLPGSREARDGGHVRPMLSHELDLVERLVRGAALNPAGLEAPATAVFVAVEGSEIVGCAAVEREGAAALLRSVAVRADRRGRGWGARLSDAAVEAARAGGATEAWLLTETAESFFGRLGWSDAARSDLEARFPRSAQVSGVCPASARSMRRDLAAAPSRTADAR
jgi:SAM-dependent methyltransferase